MTLDKTRRFPKINVCKCVHLLFYKIEFFLLFKKDILICSGILSNENGVYQILFMT